MAAKEYVGSYGKINGEPAGVILKKMRLAALERSKDKTEDVKTSVDNGTQSTPAIAAWARMRAAEPFEAGRAEREYEAFMKASDAAQTKAASDKAASDKAAADDAAKKATDAAATRVAASTTTADTAETQAAENDTNREVSSAAQVNKVRIPLRIAEEALKYPTKLSNKVTEQAAAKAEKFIDAVGPIKKAPAGSVLKAFDDAAVASSTITKAPKASGKVLALMDKVLAADKAEKLKPLLEAAAKKTEALAPFVNAAGKVGKVLSIPLKALNPLAKAMEVVDGVRFISNEKFREDSMKDMEEFGERGRKAFGAEGTLTDKVKYGGEALKQGLSVVKPLFTLGAMSTQMRESQRNAEAAGKAANTMGKRDADRKAFIVKFMRDNPKATTKDRFKALAAAFPNT